MKWGPAFGYFPNATKTWLVVKETELATAQELFHGSGVQITADHCDFKLAVARKSRPCRGTLRVLIKQIAA